MAFNSMIAAGTQFAQYGLIDTNGFLQGTSGAVAQGAAGEGMGRLLGIKTANPGPVEPENTNITGDDTVLGAIEFPPNEVPSFIIENAVFDLIIQAALQSTSVETLGDIKLSVLQPNDADYPDTTWIVQGKAKIQDAGREGQKGWMGYIVPLASAVPLGREAFAERAAASDRYRITAQIAGKKPWGVTIVTGDLGTDGSPLIKYTSPNPLSMHTFIGDGSTSIYGPLDFTPVSQAKVHIYEGNGQLLTAGTDFTVNTTTKMITRVAGALAAGRFWEVLYEFTP